MDAVRDFFASLTLDSALLYAVGAINLLGLLLMFVDKQCAKRHLWRVRERTLWFVAFCFGAVGCTAGMWLFRHKSRKPPFPWLLPLLAAVQAAALLWLYTL